MTVYNRPDFRNQRLTRGEAIREFCCDCMGGVRQGKYGPTSCKDSGCPLWRYRTGSESTVNDESSGVAPSVASTKDAGDKLGVVVGAGG